MPQIIIDCSTSWWAGLALAWPLALLFWYIAFRTMNIVTSRRRKS